MQAIRAVNPKRGSHDASKSAPTVDELSRFVPKEFESIGDFATGIPRVARDPRNIQLIESAVQRLPTRHVLMRGDSRDLSALESNSVHLVLTSPPYWTLKEYRPAPGQLGHVRNYESFLDELDQVWRHCHRALMPGGRLVCVVGDVCLARRQNNGRHTVVPLHASIQERCRAIGFDNLAPIIWHKIANASYEVEGGGAFLGKPYEPNSIIKNDIEYILMLRKPGGYRQPSAATRLLSIIPAERHRAWFQQIWSGVTGASTRNHPAPYPVELAERLVRMFSFVGDTVLDPFSGTGTTSVASATWGRNSIGCEVDPHYLKQAERRLREHISGLFSSTTLEVLHGPGCT